MLKSFLAGSFSGTCSTVLFQPLDLVKTRIQTHIPVGTPYGMVTAFKQVVCTDHLIGLWKGMSPSLARTIPGIGMYFCALNEMKRSFGGKEPSAFASIAMGSSARTLSAASLLPFTVVKTRFESGFYSYNGIGNALCVIYSKEGARGLFSGIIPTLARDAPYSGLYLMFYTQNKRLMSSESLNGPFGPLLHFSCGVVSGLCASCLTQPADVLKTKMQLYPDKFTSVRELAVSLYKSEGVKPFFIGLTPRLVRRTLLSAMSWAVYEQAIKAMGLR